MGITTKSIQNYIKNAKHSWKSNFSNCRPQLKIYPNWLWYIALHARHMIWYFFPFGIKYKIRLKIYFNHLLEIFCIDMYIICRFWYTPCTSLKFNWNNKWIAQLKSHFHQILISISGKDKKCIRQLKKKKKILAQFTYMLMNIFAYHCIWDIDIINTIF